MNYPTYEAAKEAKEKGEVQPKFEAGQRWYDSTRKLFEVVSVEKMHLYGANYGYRAGLKTEGEDAEYYYLQGGRENGLIYAKPTE